MYSIQCSGDSPRLGLAVSLCKGGGFLVDCLTAALGSGATADCGETFSARGLLVLRTDFIEF